MKTVLLTAIGSVSAGTAIESLSRNNYKVIGCDIYPKEWIANSQFVDVFYNVSKAIDSEQYLNDINKICITEHVDYIIPLVDSEIDVLTKNRNLINSEICFSSEKTIELCRNKYKTFSLLKENGIDAIETRYLSDCRENTVYPVVLKPSAGRSSQGLFIAKNKEEFEFFKKDCSTDYIVQPFINGNIVTVDIIRNITGTNTDQIVAISREEFLRTANGLGMSVQVFKDCSLEELCKKIARALDIKGCVNFEFIKSNDGQYFFVECNPRFSGGVNFSCLAGYDCIINHMRCFENRPIDDYFFEGQKSFARMYEDIRTD